MSNISPCLILVVLQEFKDKSYRSFLVSLKPSSICSLITPSKRPNQNQPFNVKLFDNI